MLAAALGDDAEGNQSDKHSPIKGVASPFEGAALVRGDERWADAAQQPRKPGELRRPS